MELGTLFGLVALLVSAVTALLGYGVFRELLSRLAPTRTDEAGEVSAPAGPGDAAPFHAFVHAAWPSFQAAPRPEDARRDPQFVAGVEHFNLPQYSNRDLLGYFTGDVQITACMALEALARRELTCDDAAAIYEGFNEVAPWTRYFALRVLAAQSGEKPLIGAVMLHADRSWEYPPAMRVLREFVTDRLAGGERPTFGAEREGLADSLPGDTPEAGSITRAEWLLAYLPRFGDGVYPLGEEIEQWSAGRVDVAALGAIGTVWPDEPEADDLPVPHDALEVRVAVLETELGKTPPRSVLLVGESGTGKTTAIRAFGRRMQQRGWTVFEAGQAELMAGMTYMGQLEERLRVLIDLLGAGKRVLWVVPDFHTFSWAGRHQYDRTSVLDYLLPGIERGDLNIVGETTRAGYQRLLQAKPRCRTAMDTLRLEPLGAEPTLQLAGKWIERYTRPNSAPIVTDETLREAWNLAQQFMGTRSAPGNLLELLSITRRRLLAVGDATGLDIGLDDLIATVSSVSGLPASILDERERLDLKELRAAFESKVMGQDDAVDCLVERLAMIKAGVTDPTRPQGVFLLVGPTGTGKTEIGKALASYLFGSPERMIRLDMSELQDEASLTRIFGNPEERTGSDSLVDQIRKQPFSVVLLDEFEKSDRRVWDLFLQVFDDGRLSDRLGRVADFRHALFLMTSNLGGAVPSGLGLGFLDRSGAFSAESLRRDVERTFRPEFLNRIDRVIVFRPLGRETMRSILRKELDEVFRRRGLRNRRWAVEWDDAALEFLLERGFTADLGARPLKRAIERHLLAPLARTIVDHRFPEGDQFLFVTGTGNELGVRFVDPEATDAAPESDSTMPAVDGELRLETVIFSPRGSAEEVALLRGHHDLLTRNLESGGLQRDKQMLLERISRPDFWALPERFTLLGRTEYLDRIESSLGSARSLLGRLEGLAGRPSSRLPRELVGKLAQQLWLLGLAWADASNAGPKEAWLRVAAGHEAGTSALSSNPFAIRLGQMYRNWGRKRGMRVDVLAEAQGQDEPYEIVLGVSGFAALPLLEPERGLHVWETPAGKREPARRCTARVRVAAQPDAPVDDPLAHARRAIALDGEPLEVVRRYRETPSPLVRDGRRGWRTGRLDRVLEGDFDLIA